MQERCKTSLSLNDPLKRTPVRTLLASRDSLACGGRARRPAHGTSRPDPRREFAMRQPFRFLALAGIAVASLAVLTAVTVVERATPKQALADDDLLEHARESIEEGRNTFRFDTFGDEAFWGGT